MTKSALEEVADRMREMSRGETPPLKIYPRPHAIVSSAMYDALVAAGELPVARTIDTSSLMHCKRCDGLQQIFYSFTLGTWCCITCEETLV